MTDPFRARTKPSRRRDRPAGEVTELPAAAGTAPAAEPPSRGQLEDMSRAQLAALARDRDLDAKGSKADLIGRLAS